MIYFLRLSRFLTENRFRLFLEPLQPMKIKTRRFRVPEGDTVDLREWPTKVPRFYRTKKHYEEMLQKHVERLSSHQQLLYASNQYAILLIFQAMDAAGKDGVIRHVMSG
ncbi:MAG TPA: hypothetical protein VG501_06720, partial [Rhizomicrobium sp.]|nr:hypothetical protein [Rhizomicrobium sp.]